MQLIGYNVVAVVKCEGSNLPLATGWVCQSDVQDSSGDVVSSCVYQCVFFSHKCKIALIAIKLLFF